MITERTIEEDEAFGLAGEDHNEERIRTIMNRSMKKSDKYYQMDWFAEDDPNLYAELKTRRYSYDDLQAHQKQSVVIGVNKIDFCRYTPNVRAYYFFDLNGELYYTRYRKSFSRLPIRYIARNREGRKNDGSFVVDIPLTCLKKVA